MKRSRTISVLTGAVLLVAVAVAVRLVLELPGHYRPAAVVSTTMAPALSPGSLVLLEAVPVSALRVDDVIVYRSPDRPGQPALLRVRDARTAGAGSLFAGRQLRLRGDAPWFDEDWHAELFGSVWRVATVVPHLGWASQFHV